MEGFSPIQSRILKVLADGKRHHKTELIPCIGDELATSDHLVDHIYELRKKLRPIAQDIISEYYKRRFWYRQVRLLWPESAG